MALIAVLAQAESRWYTFPVVLFRTLATMGVGSCMAWAIFS